MRNFDLKKEKEINKKETKQLTSRMFCVLRPAAVPIKSVSRRETLN
jgi:hypothetical protein